MPWELTLVKLKGKPPLRREEITREHMLPLGALTEVRETISEVFPGTEWSEEPALLDVLKASGSEVWKDWDEEFLAYNSVPKLRADYQDGALSISFFNFEMSSPPRTVCIEVRGTGNPVSLLGRLCERTGWSVVEACQDAEVLRFDGHAQRRWEGWLQFLRQVVDQVDEIIEADKEQT